MLISGLEGELSALNGTLGVVDGPARASASNDGLASTMASVGQPGNRKGGGRSISAPVSAAAFASASGGRWPILVSGMDRPNLLKPENVQRAQVSYGANFELLDDGQEESEPAAAHLCRDNPWNLMQAHGLLFNNLSDCVRQPISIGGIRSVACDRDALEGLFAPLKHNPRKGIKLDQAWIREQVEDRYGTGSDLEEQAKVEGKTIKELDREAFDELFSANCSSSLSEGMMEPYILQDDLEGYAEYFVKHNKHWKRMPCCNTRVSFKSINMNSFWEPDKKDPSKLRFEPNFYCQECSLDGNYWGFCEDDPHSRRTPIWTPSLLSDAEESGQHCHACGHCVSGRDDHCVNLECDTCYMGSNYDHIPCPLCGTHIETEHIRFKLARVKEMLEHQKTIEWPHLEIKVGPVQFGRSKTTFVQRSAALKKRGGPWSWTRANHHVQPIALKECVQAVFRVAWRLNCIEEDADDPEFLPKLPVEIWDQVLKFLDGAHFFITVADQTIQKGIQQFVKDTEEELADSVDEKEEGMRGVSGAQEPYAQMHQLRGHPSIGLLMQIMATDPRAAAYFAGLV